MAGPVPFSFWARQEGVRVNPIGGLKITNTSGISGGINAVYLVLVQVLAGISRYWRVFISEY